jgi:hypothetical protein
MTYFYTDKMNYNKVYYIFNKMNNHINLKQLQQ